MYAIHPYKSRVVEISAIGNPTTASAAPRTEPASSWRRDVGGSPSAGSAVLACALGYEACRENLSVFYQRVPRLFAALALARGDGSYAKLLRQLARVDLLIRDDWGPEPLIAEQQRDLLEIVEDRYSAGSLIITSQVPIDRWYEIVGNPTLADAILDRFIHNAQATYANWLATLPEGLRTS
jgi:DNA replication protein DnaC